MRTNFENAIVFTMKEYCHIQIQVCSTEDHNQYSVLSLGFQCITLSVMGTFSFRILFRINYKIYFEASLHCDTYMYI